jgi:hypothetical protein
VSDSARSPISGCTIMIVAVLVLVFLVGFSLWVPFRQAGEIEKFTQAAAAPVPQSRVTPTDPAAIELTERLEAFEKQLTQPDQEATLELSKDDLNHAIALFPQLAELRGTFHVTEVAADGIHADICYTLNGRPRLARDDEPGPIAADPRYLIGKIRLSPLLGKRELAFRVEALEVPGSTVPEGFMGHFSTLRIFEKSLADARIGPVMAQLTQARLESGRMVLARIPGQAVPEVVTDEQIQAGGSKVALFIGAAMLGFLLIAGTLLFMGYRAQLRKIEAEEKAKSATDDA